jgi:hypothetical protein
VGKPLCIDLFCGLGGWTEGFLAEGWDVVGFDNHRHVYGDKKYPAQLVLQDVLTLDGRQFQTARVIVASPPCQEFSYMAMPWSRAKQIAGALRGEIPFPDPYTGSRTVEELTALFRASLRIAEEAHIPVVIENVKGAQPWVGEARAHFGSFYLWGSIGSVGGGIAASAPKFGEVIRARRAMKMGRAPVSPNGTTRRLTNPDEWQEGDTKEYGTKNEGGSWFAMANNTTSGHSQNPDGRKIGGPSWSEFTKTGKVSPHWRMQAGSKVTGDWFGSYAEQKEAGTISPGRLHGKNSVKRAAASAQIAKLPLPLARHIAKMFKP